MGKPNALVALFNEKTKNGRFEKLPCESIRKHLGCHVHFDWLESIAGLEESVYMILQLCVDVDIGGLASIFGNVFQRLRPTEGQPGKLKFKKWVQSLPGVEQSGSFLRFVGQERLQEHQKTRFSSREQEQQKNPFSSREQEHKKDRFSSRPASGPSVQDLSEANLARSRQGVDLIAEYVREHGGCRLPVATPARCRPAATSSSQNVQEEGPRPLSKGTTTGSGGRRYKLRGRLKAHRLSISRERHRSRSRRAKSRSLDRKRKRSCSTSSRSCSSRSRSTSSEDDKDCDGENDSASGEHFVSNVLDQVRAKLRDTAGANDQHRSMHSCSTAESRRQEGSSKACPTSCQQLACDQDNDELKEWLSGLDSGHGRFLQYLQPLQREFGDLQQLAAAVNPSAAVRSMTQAVDPAVFEALGVKALGHKLVLSRAICALV